MQREEVEHSNAVSRMQHEEKLLEEKQAHDAKLANQAAADTQRLEYLAKLKALGVDINAYLAATSGRPEKLIQITDAAESGSHVHIHTTDN